MKDLVIRGGTLVDRTAAEPREVDVAIENGVLTEVGSGLADGRETVDAHGKVVTPGCADIHTHYDGRVTWRHGEHTGALPGRLIRGAQSA